MDELELRIWILESFQDKTRYTPFLKSWDKRQKLKILFLFIFVFLGPKITPRVYIFHTSNKAKVFFYVRDCWKRNILFQLKKINIFKNGYVSFGHETLHL